MPEGVTRSQILVYAALAAAVLALGLRYLRSSAAPPAPPPAARVERSPAAAAGPIVHVAGAVRRPGVYRLQPGARVDDALREAGGATSRADLSAVNLAAKAEDGRQVLVPERPPPAGVGGAAAGASAEGGAAGGGPSAAGRGAAGGPSAAGGGAAGGPSAAAGGPSAAAVPAQPLNLNTATLEQLDTLDGIGPTLAQAILAYRDEHGGFGSVDELAQVPGIGEKRMASLREQVQV